jgi:tetratricopeptide (TPR) repeat protein
MHQAYRIFPKSATWGCGMWDPSIDRFMIHQLVADYLQRRDRLEPRTAEETRGRHAAFYAGLFGEADSSTGVGHLLPELPNLRTAFQWVAQRGDGDAAAQIALAAKNSAMWRGWSGEWYDWLRAAWTLEPRTGDLRANTLQAIGDVQQFRKETDAALESYAAALELYRAVGARLGEANTLQAIGDVQQFRDERDAALESYAAALELYRAVGARLGEANTLKAMGQLSLAQGDLSRARRMLDQALDLYSAIGDRVGQANLHWLVGRHLIQRGLLEAAESELSQAVDLAQAFAPGHPLTEQWAAVLDQVRVALDEEGDDTS